MQNNKTYVIGGFGGSHFQIFFVFHLKMKNMPVYKGVLQSLYWYYL